MKYSSLVRKQNAFTLTEILIAIALIAVFTVIPVLAYNSFIKQSRDNQRKQDLGQIQSALEMYKQSNGVYPESLNDLLDAPGYIAEIPVDPLAGEDVPGGGGAEYGYLYSSDEDGVSYSIMAPLEETQGGSAKYYVVNPNGSTLASGVPTATNPVATRSPFPSRSPTPTLSPTLTPTNTPTPTPWMTTTNTYTLTGLAFGATMGGASIDSSGNLYLINRSQGNRAMKINSAGTQQWTISTVSGASFSVVNPSNNLYIADLNGFRQFNTTNGDVITTVNLTNGSGFPVTPVCGAFDSSGNFYAGDMVNTKIVKFNSSFTYQSQTNLDFGASCQINVDASNNIYFTYFDSNVSQFKTTKYNTSLVSQATLGGYSDNETRRSIAFTSAGNLIILYQVAGTGTLIERRNNAFGVLNAPSSITFSASPYSITRIPGTNDFFVSGSSGSNHYLYKITTALP